MTTWQATVYDAASRVTQIWNRNATITNAYLADNSLASQDELIKNYADLIHRKVTYAYDADGNRANVTYPSGKDFSYGYTGRNQLWYVMDDLSGIYQAVFVYDLAGNMTTRYVGNNWIVTDASQRDAANQITHLEHRLVGTARSFDYTFNARGNRLTSRPGGGTTQSYGYDPTQQVTSAPLNGATQTFGYDGNGNRTSLNGGGSYSSNPMNQYITFSGLGATYDLNGNLKTYNGWTYTYDAQNRLTTVKQGATTVAQYWYDGLNRQITRNVKGAITFHVWDGWNLIEERGTGNALQNQYLYAGDQIIGNVTTKRFFFQDSLGNTSHLSDEGGNLLEFYTYSAFGQPKFYDAAGNPTIVPGSAPGSASAKGSRHLFQGQLWTQETGLNDYRNRVALPTMGVFLQPDPIGFKGDAANLYRFCNNNAVNRTDPLGLEPTPIPPELRAVMMDGMTQTLQISQTNSDKQGKGLERGKNILRHNGQYHVGKNTSVGRWVGDHQEVPPPRVEKGRRAAYVHAHHHDSVFWDGNVMHRASTSRTSDADKNWADRNNMPIGTVTPGWRGRGEGTREIYSPSTNAGERDRHIGGGTERLKKNGEWEQLQETTNRDISSSNASSGPSAKDIDLSHQATGVPSLGAESVNYVNGKL